MTDAKPKQLSLGTILKACASAQWRFNRGMSINSTLGPALGALDPASRATAQAIVYESLRRHAFINYVIERCARNEPTIEVRSLLEVSLAALMMRFSDFTVVSQAVEAAKSVPATAKAAGFINAVLRNFLRRREEFEKEAAEDPEVRYNAPSWWIDKVRRALPEDAEQVLTSALEPPPMTIRVNRRQTTPEKYLAELAAAGVEAVQVGPDALRIVDPVPVERLPGFAEGTCSVQDAGTQLAAHLLPVAPGARVLDACAAPGGKTCHLLELNDCKMTALEIDPRRAAKIRENLERLGLDAKLVVSDALETEKWWDGEPFDAILLDAPCSASGVVRRQPDTPWLRRPSDMKQLARLQKALLETMWGTLRKGGHLLYATCSIFPEEGRDQVRSFLAAHPEARPVGMPGAKQGMMVLVPEESEWTPGECVPGVHDGFFYALLKKE